MTTCLPAKAVEHAQRLAAVVHGDGDRDDVAELLHRLTTADLYALTVTLAAMVDVDKSPAELLAWNDGPAKLHPVDPTDYVLAVADEYGVTLAEMFSPTRRARVVRARHVAMWYCVQRAHLSLSATGRMFHRDHSTVLHAVRRVESCAWDAPLRAAS